MDKKTFQTKDLSVPGKRESALSADMFNKEKRTLTLSFASETPYDRWRDGEMEILKVTSEAMDTSRFQQGVMPVLFNHDRDHVIARVDNLYIKDGKAYADITFDSDDESATIMAKVESGSLRGVSVGYFPKLWETIPQGEVNADGIKGPAIVVTKWEVLEFSIVSIPADPTVAAGRDLETKEDKPVSTANEPQDKKQKKETEKMNEKELMEKQQAETAAREEKARMAERARCTDITALCRETGIADEQMKKFIDDGTSMADVRTAVLSEMIAKNKATAIVKATVTEDEDDKIRAAVSDGILLRAGLRPKTLAEGADNFRNMRMKEVAIMCLERAGEKNARYMGEGELLKRALTTTGAFSAILDSTANKALSGKYLESGATYQDWVQYGSLHDFKAAKIYKLSAASVPTKIPEGGEFKFQELSTDGTNVQLETEGTGFTYTRQMLINDDLDLLAKVPQMIIAGFERKKNLLAYSALTGITYSSANKNLATAAALTTASLTAMRKLMRKQKDFSGKATLNIVPGYLLVPTGLETTAYQLMASSSDPSSNNAGVANAFKSSLQVVVDPALDDNSETAYYMVARPGYVDTIQVSYLNGQSNVIIDSGMDPDALGWKFRFYHDFDVRALDIKGFVKNAGV